MMDIILNKISQPWPWYVAGPVIALVMASLLFFDKQLGISGNLRTACALLGAGKHVSFFKVSIKDHIWNLVFALGLLIGGVVAYWWLPNPNGVQVSEATTRELLALGVAESQNKLLPDQIFNWEALTTPTGILVLVGGGFLVGFGARYAGGCTSGHAISGLSDLQLPSLIAVIGFFIGGLLSTNFILPFLLAI